MPADAREYYRIRLQLDPQPEGGWTISSPDVPGLVTEADRPEEIEANVRDAFQALVESYGGSPPEQLRQLATNANSTLTIETLIPAA